MNGMNETTNESVDTTCESTGKESKYYTVRAVNETREAIKKHLDVYNEKYVKKSIEAGRKFMKELNAEPLKKIDELISSGTKVAMTLREDSIKKYDELKEKKDQLKGKTREFTEKVKNSPFKVMGDIVKETKEDATRKIEGYIQDYKKSSGKVVEKIEKDVQIIKHDIIDSSKKALDKIPMKKVIEEKVTSSIEKFPSMLNLPSKKEVEELIKGIDSVNRKVDSLTRQPSAA